MPDWNVLVSEVRHFVPLSERPKLVGEEFYADILREFHPGTARPRVKAASARISARKGGAPVAPAHVLVKPYWAIASLCLAVAALTALVCLSLTTGLPLMAAIFLGLFGFGLGTSSLGLLVTTPKSRSVG